MAPWKCPECGVWWAGLEHRCQPPLSSTDTVLYGGTVALLCTCSFDRQGQRINTTVLCFVHDVLPYQTLTYSSGSLPEVQSWTLI